MSKAKKYVTVEEGTDFRTIAKIMTKLGFKMNHATARNVLILAIRNLLNYSAGEIGMKITEKQMDSLIRDQDIHTALADVLYMAHEQENDKGSL